MAVSRQAEEAPQLPGASVQPGEPAGLPLSYDAMYRNKITIKKGMS